MGILDAVHDMQKRWETSQRRMIPGSLGGRTDSASPAPRAAAPALWSGTTPTAAAAAAGVMSVLISDSSSAPASDGADVTVLFTDLTSSTHGTPDIVPTTPAGAWTLPAGIYSVSAEVRWSTFGGTRELRMIGGGFPASVPPKIRVPAVASDETVLTIASGLFHSAGGGNLRIVARQTSGGAGTVFGEWLSIVRISDYTFTP